MVWQKELAELHSSIAAHLNASEPHVQACTSTQEYHPIALCSMRMQLPEYSCPDPQAHHQGRTAMPNVPPASPKSSRFLPAAQAHSMLHSMYILHGSHLCGYHIAMSWNSRSLTTHYSRASATSMQAAQTRLHLIIWTSTEMVSWTTTSSQLAWCMQLAQSHGITVLNGRCCTTYRVP